MKKSNFVLIGIALVVITALVTYFAMKPEKKLPVPVEKPIEKKVSTIVWKAQSSYPAGLPQLYAPAEHFAKIVKQLTDGQLIVKMNPGGSIVPSKQVFDAVSAGTLDMGCTWAGWWIGKFPASVLFGNSFPNGLQMQEMLSWIYNGGGLELWNEMYKGHDIVVLPPYGMLGSENFCWSRKPINSLDDFKGLKFRTVGIWGKCLERLGARVVSLAGGEVYPSLERGVIDAAEFATPAIDRKLAFQEICKYLKVPGIHEPCAPLETLVNEKSWKKLPDNLKEKVKVALQYSCFNAINLAMKQDAEAMNFFLKYPGLNVSKLTPEMIDEIVKIGDEELDKYAKEDVFFAKVLKSQRDFRKLVEPYANLVRLPYPYAK
ncbi:MAG: TRAP transporter substrate-binding protein DctP [Deltaproteobacteria bacterium]|nr:TRAP transporter substrate-binding protein DctP [Deltaproteobacteria bacterium]